MLRVFFSFFASPCCSSCTSGHLGTLLAIAGPAGLLVGGGAVEHVGRVAQRSLTSQAWPEPELATVAAAAWLPMNALAQRQALLLERPWPQQSKGWMDPIRLSGQR